MNKRSRRGGKKIRYLGAGGIAAGAGMAAFAGAPAAAAVAHASTGTVTSRHFTARDDPTNVLTDVTTGESLTCPPWRMTGSGSIPSVGSGPATSVARLGAFQAGFSASPCTGPGGITFRAHLTGPLYINPISSADGVVHGTITGIQLEAESTTLGSGCTVSATGSASATYTKGTGEANVASADLTVHGGGLLCADLVNDGDAATYEGSLPVSSSQVRVIPSIRNISS